MNARKTGIFIRKLRLQHNLSREKLADSIGVFELTLELWERGILKPTIYDLEMLSFELESTVNELLAGHELTNENDDEIFNYAEEQRKKENFKIMVSSTIFLIGLFALTKSFKKNNFR